MPSDLENAKLMLLCLQHSNATGFNYKTIAEACGITANAASKRITRLRQAVKDGKESSLDVGFLWACLQNSNLGNIDFQAIAKELDCTANAASKRWTRLKQTLERGETGAAPARGKKRKSEAPEDGKDEDNTAVRKKGKSKVAVVVGPTTKPEAHHDIETHDYFEGHDIDAEGEIDDTYNVADATTSANPKPTTKKKAATTGPKKLTAAAAAAATRKTKSTPRHRGNPPMTEEELYAKLEIPADDTEDHEKPAKVYPRHHNLLRSLQSVATPPKEAGGGGGSVPGSNASTATIAGGDNVFFFSPTDSTATSNDVNDVFTQIADAAMQSPSKAERLQQERAAAAAGKKKAGRGPGGGSEQEWDDEVDRTAQMPNPFVSGGGGGGGSSTYFLDALEDYGAEDEYC